MMAIAYGQALKTFGRWLLSPGYATEFGAIRRALRSFAHMLASLFATADLFPSTHCAFYNENEPLSLRDVLRTAYSNLEWSWVAFPKILYFVSVVGTLILSSLYVVTLGLSFLIPEAQAQMFDPPDPGCDFAHIWINYLFLGDTGAQSPSCTDGGIMYPNGNNMQIAMADTLHLYSLGILVFAGFTLLYHLLSMVAHTANTGTPMGQQANQFWAPVRLVVAIGLLVPVTAYQDIQGLNTGQYIAIRLARMGSALGSNAWEIVMSRFSDHMTELGMHVPPPPNIDTLVRQVLLDEACMALYNQMISRPETKIDQNEYRVQRLILDSAGENMGAEDAVAVAYVSENNKVRCGSITLPREPLVNGQPAGGYQTAVWQAARAAFFTFLNSPELEQIARASLSNLRPTYRGVNETYIEPQEVYTRATNLITATRNDYQQRIAAALGAANLNNSQVVIDVNEISENWVQEGWVMAGAWFNTIARAQAAIFNSLLSSVTYAYHPMLIEEASFVDRFTGNSSSRDVGDEVKRAVALFKSVVDKAGTDPTPALAASQMSPVTSAQPNKAVQSFLTFVYDLGVQYGLWTGTGLVYNFGNTMNPMMEVAAIGQRQVAMASDLLAVGMIGSQVGGPISGITLSEVDARSFGKGSSWMQSLQDRAITIGMSTMAPELVRTVSTFVVAVGGVLFTSGLFLAYLLPLMPFFRFFFHVLTWILLLFESIVSMPLLALAHVNPYGDGLPGQMATRGYYMLLSIVLKPILMVIGLLAGFLIFFIAINFLNLAYGIAVGSLFHQASSMAIISNIIFSVIYTVIAVICANNSFKTIGYFSENIMSWIGAASAGGRQSNLGDPGTMHQRFMQAGGFISGAMMGGAMTSTAEVKQRVAQMQQNQIKGGNK
ncbi:MAG: DotA/TraY family protein [Alphaproteobacteria bacterium]|jgi:conjugal transfer/type IV secretion protein DotA/TraY|nr:DotA/TraY family protein [Alphaproteobacteria bacterium]